MRRQQRDLDLIALDDALERLAMMDERQNRIVELRFFAGLSVEDTAEVMGISISYRETRVVLSSCMALSGSCGRALL